MRRQSEERDNSLDTHRPEPPAEFRLMRCVRVRDGPAADAAPGNHHRQYAWMKKGLSPTSRPGASAPNVAHGVYRDAIQRMSVTS